MMLTTSHDYTVMLHARPVIMPREDETTFDHPMRKKGFTPTPEGRRLLARARNMFEFIAQLPPPPTEFDATNGFDGFQIFYNDRLGDCVKAEDANAALGLTFGATGTACNISPEEVKKDYFIETGGRDSGLDLATDMDWDNQHGLADVTGKIHQPGKYGSVDATNITEFAYCCYYFKRMKIGIATPSSLMNSSNGDLLDWTPGRNPGPCDHCVLVCGCKIVNNVRYWKLVTWGGIRWVTDNWLIWCCGKVGEAWATYGDKDLVNPVTGKTIDGWDGAELEKYWAIFHNQPVPPTPTPGPTPPPGPGPTPTPPGPPPSPLVTLNTAISTLHGTLHSTSFLGPARIGTARTQLDAVEAAAKLLNQS